MKVFLNAIAAVLILISCHTKQAAVSTPVSNKNAAPQIEQQDSIGILISTIEFKIKATKADGFEDGFIGWANIENPNKNIDSLIDADKIVLAYTKVKLIIDYPLNIPANFELIANGNGFSKKQIIQEISKKYHEVYAVEETTAKEKTLPVEKRKGLINRNQTNGKYGICCHDIGDLDLTSIEVYQAKDGQIYLILNVDS